MTGPGLLDDLTTQLTDFMALPADLDLPPLCAVRLYRSRMDTAWDADAQLDPALKGDDVFAAMHDWAVATGGALTLSKPHYSAGDPFRTIEVTVSHAGLAVRVWAHVDADAQIPERYRVGPEKTPALVNGSYFADGPDDTPPDPAAVEHGMRIADAYTRGGA